MSTFRLLVGDCREMLRTLPDESVHCVVTSPPYWGLRDYGHEGQLGLEPKPDEYVERMVEVFREVRRVLREDGTLWLNLGDSYASQGGAHGGRHDNQRGVGARRVHAEGGGDQAARTPPDGLKPKDLVGIPWRVAFALQADGWYLRSDIIWSKPNPMPESVRDRPTKAHEYVFLLSKSERYFYDADAIKEPLATDPRENYPARARITGRGNQGAAAARGNDRGKSGGFPPAARRQTKRALEIAKAHGLTDDHIRAIRLTGLRGDPSAEYEKAVRGGIDVDALAAEAKDALGAYYREFLTAGTRNARSVWTIATKPYPGAHFATFPPELAERCILAGCPKGGAVLDPFAGSGTTGMVATGHGRHAVLIELNPAYTDLIRDRIGPMLEASAQYERVRAQAIEAGMDAEVRELEAV